MASIFSLTNGLTQGLGAVASGTGKLVSGAVSGASKAIGAAFKDACPGTSFQLGNYRTNDGTSADPKGKFKVCQEKRLFGKNDPPFYVDAGGVKHMIDETNWSKFGYSGMRKSKMRNGGLRKDKVRKDKVRKGGLRKINTIRCLKTDRYTKRCLKYNNSARRSRK